MNAHGRSSALETGRNARGEGRAANAARAWHRSLQARRKAWLQVHLWLGLALGAVLALIGLTGTVLVFQGEIDHALNPAFFSAPVAPGARALPLERIRAIALAQAPAGWESGGFAPPREAGGTYVVSYWVPEGTPAPERAVSLNLAIDAYTGAVVGRRVFYHAWNPLKHCFVGFFFKLHYALLLGDAGTTAVGALGVVFVVSVLTGLILWWPLDGKWRRVLGIKRGASGVRFNHDLHQATGFWLLPVLLAVLVSGVYFNLPEPFRWIVERFSLLTPEPVAAAAAPPWLALDQALDSAAAGRAGGRLDFVTLPDPKTGLEQVCYSGVPALWWHVVDQRCITFEAGSGRTRLISDVTQGSPGDAFMLWQWPLHSGQAFGWPGRILVGLSGLACPLLFVTGVIRWLHKRRARQGRRAAG